MTTKCVAQPSSAGAAFNIGRDKIRLFRGYSMAALDWSQCSAVESIPGKVGGAWVFRGTRMPVATVFENLEAGATVNDIVEWFDITREQVMEVLNFAARSLLSSRALSNQ